MSRRSGLGRGLGALIPQSGSSQSGSDLLQLPLSQLKPNPLQPRQQFDEEALAALVDSVKAMGVLQPVLVRELAPNEYEIIAGERRVRAARRAGLATIPAVIRAVDDVSSLEQALVENLQREDLNALDEAGAYQQLIEDFDLTHDEVARRIGKSRTAVTNSLRLFQLPPVVQRFVRDGLLTAGHARALLGTPDRALQEQLASDAVHAGLSVRAVEDIVKAAVRADAADNELELAGSNDVATRPSRDRARVADGSAGPAPTSATSRDRQRDSVPQGKAHEVATPHDAARVPGRLRPPGVLDLEELLGNYLNTRVTIDVGGRHGRVLVEFATLDDLERIYRLIIGDATRQSE